MERDVLMVERADAADVPAAQTLIDEARGWLRSRGIDQWQDAVPDAVLLADVRQGRLFVVRDDRAVVAMVTVSDADVETWGTDSSPALYVHRLAVARRCRGSHIGQRLLSWVEARAEGSGAAFVRLDCAADNPGLRRFYEQQGFQHVRDVIVTSLDGRRQLASSLYERQILREMIAETGRGMV
ncbi:GNAT family N-acetyltransferase [Curtobacterium herbarum]|uniref:N-acetyltransferase domain-containing protein n=1 Tax=Curtobacterium herbarum TaxID=150122 RepID=A0ABP4K5V6_9MICO|nr:GNAT family N-acetyltransferase [Curtobacterium herbarum]MBM7474369.1 ribosomal protein S18 acetylase RimI-like enzyme [Curtobacterium herbarum]MCS6545755.1 GNAT family N-acetyltransferase [Curtobacterium herbarum]